MKKKILNKEGIFFIVNIFSTIIVLTLVYRLWEKDFHVPIVYNGGDGVGGLVTIQKAIQNEKFWKFEFWSAPYGENVYSQEYFFQYLVVKMLTSFSEDVGVISNAFWIITYILTSITSFFFFKKMKVQSGAIIVGSLLYNFLPYHYLRLNHFWLMGCYIIPIAGCILLDLLDYDSAENSEKKDQIRNFCKTFLLGIFVGLNGFYYAVFSIMILTIGAFLAMLYKKKYGSIKLYISSVVGIVLPLFSLYIIPLALWGGNEWSSVASGRDISQINVYGLNLALLFLPIPGHRIKLLSDFTTYCYRQMNICTENFTQSLGLIMSLGLVISVLFCFRAQCKESWQEKIKEFGIINVIVLIIATVGGIDNFIAIFISPSVRCYNRLSVFIALFSVGTVVLLLENIIIKKLGKRKYLSIIICLLVTVIGILDITSEKFRQYEIYDISTKEFTQDYDTVKTDYYNDIAFFNEVYDKLDDEKMLFIAPVNAGTVNAINQFNKLKIYVANPNIRTSYDHIDGPYSLWWKSIAKENIESQIKVMSIMGFSGIVIDKNGFDSISEYDEYIQSLRPYVRSDSIVTREGENLVFFSFGEWKNNYLKKYSESQIKHLQAAIESDIYNSYKSIDVTELCGISDNNTVLKDDIQYGPYYELDAGEYQVLIEGQHLAGSKVRATIDNGATEIGIYNLHVEENYIQYDIKLDKDCENVEFLLSNSNHDVKVTKYYYQQKRSVGNSIKKTVDLHKDLIMETGIGYYMMDMPLESFSIKGAGHVSKNQLILEQGDLQYGPYMELAAGTYRIHIEGENLRTAEVNVTYDGGNQKIPFEVVAQNGNQLIYQFYIPQNLSLIEFLLTNNRENMLVNHYTIEYSESGIFKKSFNNTYDDGKVGVTYE